MTTVNVNISGPTGAYALLLDVERLEQDLSFINAMPNSELYYLLNSIKSSIGGRDE